MSVLIAILLAAAPADSTAQAREHFKNAQLHYSLGEFEEAVKEFREAYRLRQEPAILFNIAQCHRQMRQWKDAYFNYRQYLNQKKDASNREEAESLAEQMRLKMEEEEEQKTRVARNPAAAHNPESTMPPAALPQQEPPLFPQQPSSGPKPLHIAGYATIGAGVVAGGLALLIHGSAQSSADQFNQKYQGGQLTSADAQLRDDAQSKGKTATACAIGAAVLVATGAVLSFAF
jgi:tetratricopeptide (TPR) repeat protein